MIVLELIDGAGQGNQMFMYSTAYALARKTNQKMIILFSTEKTKLENRPITLDKFNIDKKYVKKIVRIDKFNKLFKTIILKYYRIIYKKILGACSIIESPKKHRNYIEINNLNYKNYYLCGYFESYKYFNTYRTELIKQFQPNYELSESTKQLLNEISNCNSIALHIRRGDFALEGRDVGTIYYKQQIEKVRKEIVNPIFYLATIDKNVIDEFSKYNDVKIIDTIGEYKDINDWLCLKHCKHHIITNSTYSWWAAYLSDAPNKKLYIPSEEEYISFEKRDCKEEFEDFYWKEN